jgi:phage FluMu protein Com
MVDVQSTVTCEFCGAKIKARADRIGQTAECPGCKEVIRLIPDEQKTARPVPRVTRGGRKFAALRVIATVYRICGVLVTIGGLLMTVASAQQAARTAALVQQSAGTAAQFQAAALLTFGIGILATLVAAVQLFAFAEIIQLGIDIEENTRRAVK